MKYATLALCGFVTVLASCGGAQDSKKADAGPFCSDTTCISEPLVASLDTAGKAKVEVFFKDCALDSIHWDKAASKASAKSINVKEYLGRDVKISKEKLQLILEDGSYAWLKFNDCATGRGYVIKMPFNKEGTISKYTSALNSFDPKFKIEDGLIAYYDNTFIEVQDLKTQKTAKVLLTDKGVRNINFDDAHGVVDTVHITKTSLYAMVIDQEKNKVERKAALTFK